MDAAPEQRIDDDGCLLDAGQQEADVALVGGMDPFDVGALEPLPGTTGIAGGGQVLGGDEDAGDAGPAAAR